MTAHLTPYPGTPLYRLLAGGGSTTSTSRTTTPRVVHRPAASPERLAAGYRWMYRTFYSWPNLVRRWPVAEGQVTAYLQFNLVYRKYGKLTSLFGRVWGMRQIAEFARKMAYPPPHSGVILRAKSPRNVGRPMRVGPTESAETSPRPTTVPDAQFQCSTR